MWHINVTSVAPVVPIYGKATDEGAGPIDGDGVELLKYMNKVLIVLLANVLNSKIVDDKRKGDVFFWRVSREREFMPLWHSQIWQGGV